MKTTIIALITFIFSLNASSQNWTTYNGSFNDMAVDFNDNKWFASDEGVFKFDGTNWIKYTTDSGLINNQVNAIAIDSEGNKWFATSGGVSELIGKNWISFSKNDGLCSNNIRKVAIDDDGIKWFGTDNGVTKFDGVKWTTYTTDNGLVSNYITSMACDQEGNKWIGSNIGISKFNGSDWETFKIPFTDPLYGLDYHAIYSIITDPENNIWIGTGWRRPMSRQGGYLKKIEHNKWLTINESYTTALAVDAQGSIWFATYLFKVGKYEKSNITNYIDFKWPVLPPTSINIKFITVDHQGNKWFSTTAALYKYNDGAPNITLIPESLSIADTVNSFTTFVISSNVKWNINVDQSWLRVSKTSGINNDTITVISTADQNSNYRTGTLTITGTDVLPKKVIITRKNIPAYLSISNNSLLIADTVNSTSTFSISSNTKWYVNSDQYWLNIFKTTGTNDATISIISSADTNSTVRNGSLTITGKGVGSKKITITRDGIPALLSVSNNFLNLADTANSKATFDIYSNISWTINCNQQWLTIIKNRANITVIATANQTNTPRTAELTILGDDNVSQKVTVTQAAISTDIINIEKKYAISLYPNPIISKLTIVSPNARPVLFITLYSANGTKVYSTKVIESLTELDMSKYKPGLYFIEIVSDTGYFSRMKIIKQ
jgi:ligand-binding sensor domain-containing protein